MQALTPRRAAAAASVAVMATRTAQSLRSTGSAQRSLEMNAIAADFASADNPDAARAVAFRAIRFYATNSNAVNGPLRAGVDAPMVEVLRRAIDYGLSQLPDYGQPRDTLHRRVHFSQAKLDDIVRSGQLNDPAFTSTTALPFDNNAYSARNTVMHINARHAANIAMLSPDPHAREHLLPSRSTFALSNARVMPVDDEDDPLFDINGATVRAELWMRQNSPPDAQ